MLKKLLKYDLKYIYKSQFTLYGITLVCLIIAKIFQTNADKFFIYHALNLSFLIFTYIMIFVLIINNLTKLWNRFKNSMYGEESYLIHTIPATKKELFLSKTLSSIISLFSSVFFIAITDFVINDFKPRGAFVYSDNNQGINDVLNQYMNNLNVQGMMWFTLFMILIVISLIGYFSIILGYESYRNKNTQSIIIGSSLLVLTFVLNFIFYSIIGIFNEAASEFFWGAMLSSKTEKSIILITIIFLIISSLVYYSLGLKNFKKGINVE